MPEYDLCIKFNIILQSLKITYVEKIEDAHVWSFWNNSTKKEGKKKLFEIIRIFIRWRNLKLTCSAPTEWKNAMFNLLSKLFYKLFYFKCVKHLKFYRHHVWILKHVIIVQEFMLKIFCVEKRRRKGKRKRERNKGRNSRLKSANFIKFQLKLIVWYPMRAKND